MASIHQLRCFLAALEHGSFTAAAGALGYAQPSVSEQVRLLERGLGTVLFHRVGRGLVATEAAHQLQPYAETALTAVADGERAVAAVREVEAGTVRVGVFGTARIYLGAALVADILEAHPNVRVEVVGRNSSEVLQAVRAGTLEGAVVTLPIDDAALEVSPVARDELLYVSRHPERTQRPVTPEALAAAPLVLSEASWGTSDSTRRQLARAVQSVGGTLRPRVDVEDLETALDVAARGFADAIVARGVLRLLAERVPAEVTTASLRPALYDEFAVVRRRDVVPSAATQAVLTLVAARMHAVVSTGG